MQTRIIISTQKLGDHFIAVAGGIAGTEGASVQNQQQATQRCKARVHRWAAEKLEHGEDVGDVVFEVREAS